MISHLLQEWELAGAADIAVVCARGADEIQREMDGLQFPKARRIINPTPEHGMFSSIQCAARFANWKPALTHWVVTLGDQPHLRRETLSALLDFSAAHPEQICQPMRMGHRRHPVLLPRPIFLSLAASSASDLKAFLAGHANVFGGFESSDAGLDLDMDTPDDYERARQIAFPETRSSGN